MIKIAQVTAANPNKTLGWHPLIQKGGQLKEDLARAMVMLGTPTRFVGENSDDLRVEVLCSGPAEAQNLESLFNQVLADQYLRREIASRANIRVSEIVDAVIGRASGG